MQADPAFIKQRSEQLYRNENAALHRRKDRMFAVLLVLQWLAGIALASWYTPSNWIGRASTVSIELWTAIGLGGLIVALPLFFIFRRPGAVTTRHVVAAGQMLSSALLIHLSGGRIETHFHIFGSLAFLAFYRDWRVLMTATLVVAADHFLRGAYWPQSIYGATAGMGPGARWRWLEHTGWVLFEVGFLIYASLRRNKEAFAACERQAELEDSQGSVERTVSERTAQLAQSNRELARQVGERQRAEQELRAARDELEARVRERTGELGAANRALKRQIDEGRKTEEELARSMQRYRFVTDSVPQIVWTAPPDGNIDYFNRRFHEYTGLTNEEVREWGWKAAIHADDLARCTELWNHAVETGEVYEQELRMRRGADGAYRWHLSRAQPMRDLEGHIIQWFGASTDIDDQKRSREVIKRSEQRYRSLVVASAQIVWLADAECRVTADLPEWRAATGQTFEEILGYGWLQAIHPEDQQRATELWRWALETKTAYENEHRMRMHDGSYRHFASRSVPVLEADGRIREWIGTSADITERKQAEEVLRRAQEELEARVRERTSQLTETNRILHQQVIERKQIEAELAEARDDALRSARLKSQFLANMSHEIRTPMNGVIGMTSLLMDTPLNEEQREYIETIRASGDSLLSIINDILDFSKIEAGKLDFEQLDFDLQSTVESVVELLAEKAQAKSLDLACHVLEDVPRQLRGDPGRLRQVLVNLVGNAVKFTHSGRVLVHVAKLQETGSDVQMCFQVSDTGIGLSKEAASGLFQAFVQADGSMTRKFGGTGLGLAISKQLVELMGGQIGVESTPGEGSTFWFTVRLPKQPIMLAEEDVLSDPNIDFSAARSLIVGPGGTCGVLREQLTSWGMQTETLSTGQEALTALRAGLGEGKPFGFVLVDAILTDMDGPTLARAIKSDVRLASTRVVILLGPGQRASSTPGEGGEIHAFLNKPIKRTQLRDYFRAALASAAQPVRQPVAPPPPPTRSANKRGRTHVLIAEDNQVNQKVIIRQLQKIGYKADAVANGIEALVASSKVAYDVIIMDCQMPEMDGFTATREIRHREADTGIHTPIVALTANALEGDRERCLEAGMDDYMSKPVKLEALQATLEKWTTGTQSVATQAEAARPVAA
jgi:two-component system sensor histidine kinase/response regulator